MRFVMFFIGMVGTIWFSLPLLAASSINIGNATGIFLSCVLLFYSIGRKRIKPFLVGLWKSKRGKIIYTTLGMIIVFIAMLALGATVCMCRAAYKSPGSDATVVVLGCRVYGERPSLMLQERLDAAYQWLMLNPDATCIVSGGQGPGEDISEAECMYRYLVEKGISPKRLLKEEKSTSTRENLAFSKEILERQGEKQQVQNNSIVIVTNEFHQYRAGKIAESLGLEYGAVNGKTALWLLPTYYVRELYGIVYEWVL